MDDHNVPRTYGVVAYPVGVGRKVPSCDDEVFDLCKRWSDTGQPDFDGR